MEKNLLFSSLFFGLGLWMTLSPLPCRELSAPESPGKLSRVHGEWAGRTNCVKCHTSTGIADPSKCLDCHRELARRIREGRGYHRDKGEDCAACHPEHRGERTPLIEWDPGEFDHGETGYALTGFHRTIQSCDRCHTPANAPPGRKTGTFLLKSNRCPTCHTDAHRGNQPQCTDCHTTEEWYVDIW